MTGPSFLHQQINTSTLRLPCVSGTMPSSSPPPPPASSSDEPSSSTSGTRTPRRDSVAAFPRLSLSRLAIPVGQHSQTASSPESSASASTSPAHATSHPAASGVHASPSTPTSDRESKTSSARARRVTVSDAVASSSTSSYAEAIEMDPINPAGHRRRRSSLMSPSSSTAPQMARNGHTRGPSVSGQFVMDEPKISEESEATIKGKNGVMRASPRADFSDEDLHDDEETGLTAKERKRKQRKRRRNTLLDQRIARDNVTAEEKKQADQNVVKNLTVNGCLIGLWYLFSLCISLVSPVVMCKMVPQPRLVRANVDNSTTNGCSTPTDSTFPTHYSPPPCTCLCSSHSPAWCSILFRL